MSEFVDPEELPFTEDELFEAGCLFISAEAARELARCLAELGPGLSEAREQRRAQWRASGVVDAHWMPLHAWVYPDELLPALASLSADAEARALFLKEDSWRGLYRRVISRMQQDALELSGAMPSREEIIRRAAEAAVTKKDKRLLKQGLVFQGPPPPLSTTAMVKAAHDALAAERAKWYAAVERYRGKRAGLDNVVTGE